MLSAVGINDVSFDSPLMMNTKSAASWSPWATKKFRFVLAESVSEYAYRMSGLSLAGAVTTSEGGWMVSTTGAAGGAGAGLVAGFGTGSEDILGCWFSNGRIVSSYAED